MIRALCVWIARFCMRHVTSWPWPVLLTGLGCGFLLLALQQQFLSQLGSSRSVIAAAYLVMGLAWAIAWGSRQSSTATSNRWRGLTVSGMLVAGSLAVPWLWNLHDLLFHESLLGSRWLILAYAAVWAIVTLGLPVWAVGRLSLQSRDGGIDHESSPRPSAACVLGISLGLGGGLMLTWGSMYVTACLGAAVLLAAQIWMIRNELTAVAAPNVIQSGMPDNSTSANLPQGATWNFRSPLVALACGGLAVWGTHVIGLLLPGTIYTQTAIGFGVLLGVAYGVRAGNRAVAVPVSSLFHRCCLLATQLVLCAGFSTVVYRLLSLTGSVSQVWLLHSYRLVFIGSCMIPLGFAWALAASRIVGPVSDATGQGRSRGWGLSLVLALAGGFLNDLVLQPVCGLTATCYVWLWVIAGVQLVELVRSRLIPRHTLVRGFALGCLCALIVAPVVSAGVRPELAGRLLFSTNVYQANEAGIPSHQLAFLDDTRLASVVHGDRGVYTVWKAAVTRHHVRENGIPHGTISTNTEICPQATSEVVLALLPLTLHERPQRVALLGLGASTPLQTCLECPVLEVTATESDPHLVTLLQRMTANTEAAAPWQDERLTLQTADPALWVAGSDAPFDVIISDPDQSALVQGSSLYTSEFYQRASRRLTADGIFCQRFQFYDYGPGPLQTMAATLRGAFKHVVAVEIGPGEIAWLGTNSESGLIRDDLVNRMQAPHVRHLMATVGWDWSVLLTLGAYDNACLDKILAGKASHPNSAVSGRFVTYLPGELMRWGPKAIEMHKAVTTHASKILTWVGESGTDEDLLRRLGEVKGQQELVAKYPDQYWGYRSQVRKQISSRPLSRIQQIKYEEKRGTEGAGLHPDDKRRLRYFQQLSKAIHSEKPIELEKLAAFDSPYDPLVSLFMHQELAEIAARVPEVPPSLELTHRLHMLYFSPSTDTSVRNALSGLRLVLEKPTALTSEAARWDVINSLLQILQVRWENRDPSQTVNPSQTAHDVEENIVLAERSLEELPALAPAVGFSTTDWAARKRNIERNLLGPLRTYRDALKPFAEKQKLEEMEGQLDSTLPSEEDLQFPGSDSAE